MAPPAFVVSAGAFAAMAAPCRPTSNVICAPSPLHRESQTVSRFWGRKLATARAFKAYTPKFNRRASSAAPTCSAADGAAAIAAAVKAVSTLPAEASDFSNAERVQVLSEALPYMQRFTGKTMVIKYGGAAMKDESLKAMVIRDLVFLSVVGIRPIFVHGGGPEINGWLAKVGIEPNFKNGLRVTDGPTMEVVEMVLTGKVNKGLVALINAAGGQAVGLCGKDGNMISVLPESPDYGFVGEPGKVNPRVLDALTSAGYLPVVASVAADQAGQAYNINADTMAGEVAAAVRAEKLILLTDVPGILKDPKDVSTLYPSMTVKGAQELIDESIVSGGMIPKVKCCMNVLKKGVKAAHIIDGRKPHSLLLEIFTSAGIGTMLLPDDSQGHFETGI
mmetsp:Transcript_643/g.1107  ORF Transcript_643/g.1107 Transcript_643/m.1107 type:complete len:391 (+) Transcript_643:80-1252(+)